MTNRSKPMLAEGELDAVFHSDLIWPFVAGDPRVARLFPDHKAEEMAYFKRSGIFLIMHVLAIRNALVDENPWLAVNLFRAFNEAKAAAMKRMANPRIVPLAWYRDAWEEQERILGPDPWEYGLTGKTAKSRNPCRLFTRAGSDQEAAGTGPAFSQRRPGPQARRRVSDLELQPSWPRNPELGTALNRCRACRGHPPLAFGYSPRRGCLAHKAGHDGSPIWRGLSSTRHGRACPGHPRLCFTDYKKERRARRIGVHCTPSFEMVGRA